MLLLNFFFFAFYLYMLQIIKETLHFITGSTVSKVQKKNNVSVITEILHFCILQVMQMLTYSHQTLKKLKEFKIRNTILILGLDLPSQNRFFVACNPNCWKYSFENPFYVGKLDIGFRSGDWIRNWSTLNSLSCSWKQFKTMCKLCGKDVLSGWK